MSSTVKLYANGTVYVKNPSAVNWSAVPKDDFTLAISAGNLNVDSPDGYTIKPDAYFNDAVLWDNQESKQVIAKVREFDKYDTDRYTPIGVVAIPAEHDVYGTGLGAMLSIREMSCLAPDEGADAAAAMMWGVAGRISEAYTSVPILSGNVSDPSVASAGTTGYLPSDKYVSGTLCAHDTLAKYSGTSSYAPSPYTGESERNPIYFSTEDLMSKNVFAFFDGKEFSKRLLDTLSNDEWKSLSEIANAATALSPAICTCWRYHTVGTEQGEWYLPSIAELGYVVSRMGQINNTLIEIVGKWGIGIKLTNNTYLTSTQRSSSQVWGVNLSNGYASALSKSTNYYVRAMAHIGKDPQPPVVDDPNKKPTGVTVITLDQTVKDPEAMVSGEIGWHANPWENAIAYIKKNTHRYVGQYSQEKGMVLKQLDDTNSERYADGTSAASDIQNFDVFTKLPDWWFKGVKKDDNDDIYEIHFTVEQPEEEEGWTKWDGNTLIGTYEAQCENTSNNTTGGLFSRSGVTPTVNVSQANFKAKARTRSNGDDHFMIVTYEAHQALAILFMGIYGYTHGQDQCGSGSSSYPKVTGASNDLGMTDTLIGNSTSKAVVNFLGLENWWGDIYEWVDNLNTANTTGLINIFEYSGTTRKQVQALRNSGYVSKMVLGEALDMIPKEYGGSATTGYCDYGYVSSSSGYVAYRSYSGSHTTGGPFCLHLNNASSYSDGYVGSRLLYSGKVVIDDGSEPLISSVEVNPVAAPASGPSKARAVSPASAVTAQIVIKGQNLDKFDAIISNLPEGVEISELSEGTTERTAILTATSLEAVDNLKFVLGGYEIVIGTRPVDLQAVIYKEQPVLRTGMDFHICNVNENNLESIKLEGLNLDPSHIVATTPEEFPVIVSISDNGELSVIGQGSLDGLSIELSQNEQVLGTIQVHSISEDEVLAKLQAEQEIKSEE